MARGKIQIKRIENVTNRQVTYSKRRNGLIKKANELAVLSDAKVSLLLVSCSGKLQEFISPGITTKQVYDEYQKFHGIDLWKSHYETMQEKLKKLKETNNTLRRQISHRLGEGLNDLRFAELQILEEEMESSAAIVRQRREKMLTTQCATLKKKVRSLDQNVRTLCESVCIEYDGAEDPRYGLFEDGGGDYYYDSAIGYSANENPQNVLPFRLQPSHHASFHHGEGGSDLTTYTLL